MTITDIARLAGVSKATVSRVLNEKPDVDPETRERILRLVEEYGFVPSIVASGLAGGRSRLLGILIPSLTWPLMPEVMRGIGELVEQTAYELVLYTMSQRQDRSAVIDRILAAKLTSGLLAVFPGQSTEHLNWLHDQGFPVVMIDDQGATTRAPWVGTDNRAGAYAVVRHLLNRGHRRIAHIQGPSAFQVSKDRYAGYRDALTEAGIALEPSLLEEGDFKPPSGRVCAEKLLALPERPTAIFAANDEMAYGVLAAAEERGLRIPEDLAVAGFDDIASSAHIRPALTTVRQPFFEMGQTAIRMLLSLVDAPRPIAAHRFAGAAPVPSTEHPESNPVRVQIPSRLIVRESCGATRGVVVSA
ncbi:MAG TPA: LacI family DNA-binding transcriptional regulator [Ktedonobacterales bacterium]|nr:LacI family DNA-binding transcriptional regulator [Ktedonobacterales bacterium]